MFASLIVDRPKLKAAGPVGRVGLLALSSDLNIEAEFHRMLPRGVSLITTRIENVEEITQESLLDIEAALVPAARSLAPNTELDVLVYGCTSGSVALGEKRVEELLGKARPTARCVTPSGAVEAGLRSLGARRISLLAPYSEELTTMIAADFEKRGYAVANASCFGFTADSQMTAIAKESWIEAARSCYDHSADALFISCTSVRASAVIDDIEAEIQAPVICSNQAVAWQIGNHLGVLSDLSISGRLSATKLATPDNV
ncbi:maleate cis-trans isomerase family protein [Pelagibius marinus]|uniref:maleate cis-trans isomerase family protein n=1 Tax=Pelagibius marinus TaxID=2762760 RepID=UPI0018727B55|nr:Asp/Glu racemase [Pelagibius marinus]